MTTFKISIHLRENVRFGRKPNQNINTDLTREEAINHLKDLIADYYPEGRYCADEAEYIFCLLNSEIYTQAEAVGMNEEQYYQVTKKRWKIFYNFFIKNNSKNQRYAYEGAGFYEPVNHYGCLLKDGGDSFEFDSRVISIIEE